MILKINKNTILEFNTTGDPDNTYWHRGWRVSLGRRYFTNRKYTFYFLIWKRDTTKGGDNND